MLRRAIVRVDDEAMILESLKEQLKRDLGSDYRIEVAESGEEALKILDELTQQKIEVPIIISDHIMPGMNGEELLSKVHARFPETLKIFLTGRADAGAVGNAVNSANLYRYISKPWEAEDLRLTVTEGLRSYFQERTLEKQREKLKALFAQAEKEIAERKQAEQRFRELLECAPNAMILSDQEGKIILVNAQTEKLFGYLREELLGMEIEALIPAYRRQQRQHRQGYHADPKVRPLGVTRDLQGLRKDGSTIPIEVSLGHIQIPEGMVVMATIFDITERKHAEQRLENQYQFERLISELSARFVNIPPDQVDRE